MDHEQRVNACLARGAPWAAGPLPATPLRCPAARGIRVLTLLEGRRPIQFGGSASSGIGPVPPTPPRAPARGAYRGVTYFHPGRRRPTLRSRHIELVTVLGGPSAAPMARSVGRSRSDV